MATGRKAHYVPRVKDVHKREVSFSLVPSNLGRRGKACSYSARLKHNQVLDEEAVVSEMCEEFNLPKNRVVQNLQQISDYLSYSATRMELRFDGEIAAGPYQVVLRRMNADGKSYALARLKVEVV